MAKLANFIEQYLKNKKISDYEGWLALYGKDAESVYAEEKAAADTEYAKARAEYGKKASSLYARGLSGSGYSDYLTQAAYGVRAASHDRAFAKKAALTEENERGYLSYLEGLQKEEESAVAAKDAEEKKIFTDLLSKNIMDEKSALTYLLTRGVEAEKAQEMAKKSIEIMQGTRAYFNQIVSELSAMKWGYRASYQYALEKGLSESAAESIATIVSYTKR